MSEEPSIVYGRLAEAVHVAGYTFERAWRQLEWLLEEHRWQQVGPGYRDINTFLATITLPEGITPERRKTVAARIKALQPAASQRKIAGALGVDHTTVGRDLQPRGASAPPPAPESSNGAVPYAPRGASAPPPADDGAAVATASQARQVAHVSHNSGEQEWYTPAPYLAAARQVLGAIDLDPASTPQANHLVQARCFYSQTEDGLAHPWQGRVWLNPPYAAELIGKFTHKLCQHLAAGEVSAALVLVNNATETSWFQELAQMCQAVCFPAGRVRFLSPAGVHGAPLQGQAVLYSGPQVDQFLTVFRPFGGLWRRDATDTR